MFGWEFPPFNSGGLGVACAGLAEALHRSGVRVTFVLPRAFPIAAPFVRFRFADEGEDVYDPSPYPSAYPSPQEYEAMEAAKGGGFDRSLLGEVRRYARRARGIARSELFDVIHAHDWLSFGAGIEAKRLSGKPLIVHVHATEFDRTGGHSINREVYECERQGMAAADAVIVLSNFMKGVVMRQYGIPEEKIVVVYNGIDTGPPAAFSAGNAAGSALAALKARGKKIIIFVGRITLQKGPDYFLRAARIVVERDPNALFIIAGGGDMERQMLRETARQGLSHKVIFTGFLRGEELASLYRAADLFVMPSVSEPFGLVALEAVKHGTPAIISKQSGVSEVLRHALTVDFWDVDELANKILSVLRHPSLATTLQENASRELPHMSWTNAAQKVQALYRRFVSWIGV